MKLWKSKEEKAMERQIKARQGKKTIQRYVKKQKEMLPKLWQMGREALRLEDQGQFKQVIIQYLWTEQQIKRWERYLLTYEMVEARRDQAGATREFLGSLQAMGQSMLADANPQDVAQMQKDLQMGLTRAESMEERMNLIMEMTDDFVYEIDGMEDSALSDIQSRMAGENEAETDTLDAQIAEGLKRIETQMRQEPK